MATETITYDPTDDSVVIQQGEERDAENLEVGEKMMAEQDQLLAGKYKTTEDLEKGYRELEKKLGQKDDNLKLDKEESTAEESESETPEFTEKDFYTEDGSVNYETADQVYGEKISNIFKENEIDPFKMNEHFVQNNGTLTDEMYDTLNKAGLNRSVVDQYLDGVRNASGVEQEAPVLNDQEVAEVHSIAGGKDGYEQLMNWAGNNLSPDDSKNFDEIIDLGNKAAIKFAVKALMGQYEDAVGRDSDLITGKKSSTETYRSMAEVVRDMGNPLYDRDEAYRDDVRRKLEASNLKI